MARMPGWIGPWELVILLIVVLLVFGPKRLPEMGRSLGRGMREFKNSISGGDDDEKPEPTARVCSAPPSAARRGSDARRAPRRAPRANRHLAGLDLRRLRRRVRVSRADP